MSTNENLKANERTSTMLWANTWGLTFLCFAILADIIYRSIVLREAPWDLFALLGLSGVISAVYAAQHNVCVYNRKSLIVMVIGSVFAAVVAAIVARTIAM